MTQGEFQTVGEVAVVTKQISEADIALFELVTKDALLNPDDLAGDDLPAPNRQPRQAAPFALLAAFLSAAAARHTSRPAVARFEREAVRFAAPIYTDDTVSAVARVTAYDSASHRLHVSAHCDNQEGLRLAEGEFILVVE